MVEEISKEDYLFEQHSGDEPLSQKQLQRAYYDRLIYRLTNVDWSKYIIVTDLDGTVTSKSGVPWWVSFFLQKITCPVIFASGRTHVVNLHSFLDMGLANSKEILLVSENGGIIYYDNQEHRLSTNTDIIKFVDNLKESQFLFLKKNLYQDTRYTDYLCMFNEERQDQLLQLNNYLATLEKPLQGTMGSSSTLHIHYQNLNKWTGLTTLLNAKKLNNRKIIYFGNSWNDIPIFKNVNISYAINARFEVSQWAKYEINCDTVAQSIYIAYLHLCDTLKTEEQ